MTVMKREYLDGAGVGLVGSAGQFVDLRIVVALRNGKTNRPTVKDPYVVLSHFGIGGYLKS